MRRRRRVDLLAGALIVGLAIALGVAVRVTVETPALEGARERMARELALASEVFESVPVAEPSETVARLGALLGVRVTLVDPEGWVLADSGVPGGDVRGMENHLGRPEIAAALRGERVVLVRDSPTLGTRGIYAAGPVRVGERTHALRLGLPTGPFREPFRRLPLLIAAMAAAALGVFAAGHGVIEARARRRVALLEGGLRRMVEGDFASLPDRSEVPEELAGVATAAHRAGEELSERLEALERARQEMRALVDSIAEGVIALTADARVLHMNRSAAELLDTPRAPAFAPIGTLVRHPDLRDHLEGCVVRPLAPIEVTLGDRRLLVAAHPMEPGGAVVTFMDVSDLRRMEQVRRDFVANASHELKTPLTAMRGYAETLLDGDTPEHLRLEFLASIHKNTVRLQHLVDDLLDLSRLESGAWTVQDEEVEIAPAAREAWGELVEDHREREVAFTVRGDAVVLADGRALHQIFRNLLDNALRHTPDGGSIEVVAVPVGGADDLIEVRVRDSGSGIASSALPRIFERFYRGDAGRDRAAGGTGLGLAIVRHLVQSMGGEVGAESRLGEGTTIRFTLPRADPG